MRSIQKSKRSYYVTLPIAYVRKHDWDKPGKLVIVRDAPKALIIEDGGSGHLSSAEGKNFALKFSLKSWRRKTSKK